MAGSEDEDYKSPENVVKTPSEVYKVSVKIPPFWSDRPEVWFFQIEAQFKIGGITSEETKFNYIVAQLEPRYVENIWDIVTGKSEQKYADAKNRLLGLFQESETNRMKKLLTGMDMGDLKPSQFLQKLKTLATSNISETLLKTLWLEKLPDYMKNIILVSNEELPKLAAMADKIADMNPSRNVCAVSASNADLLERISFLEKKISSLTMQSRQRSPARQPDRSRRRSTSRKRYNPKGSLCFYHFKFGEKCYPEKCKPPCSWKPSENSQVQ